MTAKKTEPNKPKGYGLKEIPSDVYDIIIDKQLELKKSCHCIISIEQIIYKLIRKAKNLPLNETENDIHH